jgi:hypothetical protein
MRVRMACPFVRVRVRMLTGRIDVVRMRMMAIVVPVGVLVLLRFVRVHVVVGLRHVKPHADRAQGARNDRGNPAGALTDRPGGHCAEKRGGGKDGPGSRRPDETLRAQVQAQAQSVADSSAGDQADPRTPARQRFADRKSQPCRERCAERSLCQDDLRGVAIGERTADDVVGRPRDRRADDGKRSPATGHREGHAPSNGLVPDDAREQNREDSLETQKQRRGDSAGMLEAPCQSDGCGNGSQQRDQRKELPVTPTQRRIPASAGKCRDERCSRIEERSRGEWTDATTEALHERRRHAKRHRGCESQRGADGEWVLSHDECLRGRERGLQTLRSEGHHPLRLSQ